MEKKKVKLTRTEFFSPHFLMPPHSSGRLSTYMKRMGSCKTCFFSSGGCFGFGGGRRAEGGHATRTLSGSCHPRNNPRWFHVKQSRVGNRDLSPLISTEVGRRRPEKTNTCEAPYFSGREEKVEMTEKVP